MADLSVNALHASLTDRALNAMNFLNEISHHYPEAISLAAGRPTEEFFDLDDVPRYLALFGDHLRAKGLDEAAVRRTILQYGRTKGIVHELVARNLAVDEDIHVDPEAIVVTPVPPIAPPDHDESPLSVRSSAPVIVPPVCVSTSMTIS